MTEQTFDYAKFITMLETHNWRYYVQAPSATVRSLGDMERLAIVNVLVSKEVPYEARLLFHAYRKAYDPSYEPFDMPKEEADAI